MQFLALGDSYTIGESVPTNECWPVQLASMLRKRGFRIADPLIIAGEGWTTDELMAAIKQTDPQGKFDLVSLQIGVNNQYRGGEIGVYRAEFRTLLEWAIEYAGGEPGRVVVLSIPDWSVTPFAEDRDRSKISDEIDLLNQVNLQETALGGARYVDITPQSRCAAQDSSLLAPDGLHPSGEMYAAWVRLVLPAALAAL
jgi:lysophospholipase L1-like esterase